MAPCSYVSSDSIKSSNNSSKNPESPPFHFLKDCEELANMCYDGRRLKWMNNLDSLKKIIRELFDLQGKWLSPGGGSKKFSSTNANLTITWYCGKQNTLLFQGKDGNSLRERCVYICQTRESSSLKSPNLTNERQTDEILVGLDNSSCVFDYSNATNIAENKSAKSMSTPRSTSDPVKIYSPTFTSCHCSCGILAAELEGVKLDLVIMQKSIDSVADSTVRESSRVKYDDEINRLQRELLSEKEKTKQLEADLCLVIRNRNKEVDKLKMTINSLENKTIKNDESNASLRLALDLIMQTNKDKEAAAVNEPNHRNNGQRPNDKDVHSSDKLCGNKPIFETSKPRDGEVLQPSQCLNRDCNSRCPTYSLEKESSRRQTYCLEKEVHGNLYKCDETSKRQIQARNHRKDSGLLTLRKRRSTTDDPNKRNQRNVNKENHPKETTLFRGNRKIIIGELFSDIGEESKRSPEETFRTLKYLPL